MATPPEDRTGTALAQFAVHAGPRIGEELPVLSPRVSIGSGSENDLVVADDSVSTSHALLEYDHGGWRLTDLDSTNGTYVENVRMAPHVPTPLPYGSLVRFGGLRLHFRPVEKADPDAARATYQPKQAETRLAERKDGFRMPLWMLVLILLVVLTVAVAVFAWMQPSTPPTPPVPVEQTLPAQPEQPAQVAPPGVPIVTDTPLAETVLPPTDTGVPPAGDTVAAQPLDQTS